MYSSGHIPYAVGLDGVLAEGMDEIAHIEELLPEFFDVDRKKEMAPEEWITYIAEVVTSQVDPESGDFQTDFAEKHIETLIGIATRLKEDQVPVCTTMVIDDLIQMKLFAPEAFLTRPENRYFEEGYVEVFQSGEEKHQVQCRGIETLCAFKYDIDRWVLQGLHKAGVLLLLGTDSGTGGMGIMPGYSIHDELRILVENGFSPYEALASGTVNAALVVERMTGKGDFGVIETGKRADLILVADNPLEDLDTIKMPLGVMAAGRWYSKETLAKLIEVQK
jgi:hypothetical protein